MLSINAQKTLESYDFTFNLGVNQTQIMDLATCHYLEEKGPVLIVGPCGTGKSHLPRHWATSPYVAATKACSPLTLSCWAKSLQAGRKQLRAQVGGTDQGRPAHHR